MGLRTHAWLEDWISGVDLWKRLVVLKDKVIVNPFTKQAQTVKVVAGTTGTPHLSVRNRRHDPQPTSPVGRLLGDRAKPQNLGFF
jgi:hypothetical protein